MTDITKEIKKKLAELVIPEIYNKCLSEQETHHFVSKLEDFISQALAENNQRVIEKIKTMPTGLNHKIRIGENESACKGLNVTIRDIQLHNSHADGYDEGYKDAVEDKKKWRDKILQELEAERTE